MALSGFKSPKVRNAIIIVIAISLFALSVAYLIQTTDQFNEHTSGNPQTKLEATFTTDFPFDISITYSGSWRLVYWGLNGTMNDNRTIYCNVCYGNEMEYNVVGNLTGSGNYNTQIVTYGIGYVENTLCANLTRLDSSQGNLTLMVSGTSNSTDSSSIEVCATYAV